MKNSLKRNLAVCFLTDLLLEAHPFSVDSVRSLSCCYTFSGGDV